MSIAKSIRRSLGPLPLRAFTAGVQATTALTTTSVTTAAAVAGTLGKTAGSVAKTSVEIAAIPLREGAKVLSGELSRETLNRHCWRGESRAWIEVRGLDRSDDGELGRVVLDAVRAQPGVASASLNYPLSRVVVEISGQDASLRDLCRVVEDAENRCRVGKDDIVPGRSLPGDGVVLATRALTVATNAAGLGIALTGRALFWPRLPVTIAASVTFFDYQPWLRRRLEDRIGGPATDTVMTLVQATNQTLSQSATSLSLGLTIQSLKAAEVRAEARAWEQHEPELARHADQPFTPPSPRPQPSRGMERIPGRFALLQALSAGAIGAGTRNPNMAATAVQVTTPKANRTTPEAFATTLARGLAEQHSVLPLRPESL
ncbi:MAG: cation-transporting P-type ATPase, partial [Mycobacterium sp.]|nr:cation-transporting P-type ATPase [Mycobacterium sp.]